jgi:hypothetical protein
MMFGKDRTTHVKRYLLCIQQVHKEILKLSVGIELKGDDHECEIREVYNIKYYQ